MKIQIFLVLVLAITVLVLSGCGDIDPVRENQSGQAQGASVTVTSVPTTEPSISEQPTVTITVTSEPTQDERSPKFIESDEYFKANAVADDQRKLEIPMYEDEKLVHAGETAGFRPGRNMTVGAVLMDFQAVSTWRLREYFPNPGIRKKADETYYWVYDFDSGKRLYLFFDERVVGKATAIGYPIIIQVGTPLKSFSDFVSIKVGCTLRDVEQIDPITEAYRRDFVGADGLWLNKKTSTSRDWATVHYLADGLLVIHYFDINEQNELLVSKIEFFNDYRIPAGVQLVFPDMDEVTIDYRLNPLDLPYVE